MEFALTLADRNDLRRICELLTKQTEIMELLNDDSQHSAGGGAAMSYKVKIKLKENWV